MNKTGFNNIYLYDKVLKKEISKEKSIFKKNKEVFDLKHKLTGKDFFNSNLGRVLKAANLFNMQGASYGKDYYKYLNKKLDEIFPETKNSTANEKLLREAYLSIAKEKSKENISNEQRVINVTEILKRFELLYVKSVQSNNNISDKEWLELNQLAIKNGIKVKDGTLLKLVDVYRDYSVIKHVLSNKNNGDKINNEITKNFGDLQLNDSFDTKISSEKCEKLKQLTSQMQEESDDDEDDFKLKLEKLTENNELSEKENDDIDLSEESDIEADFDELFKKFETLREKDKLVQNEKKNLVLSEEESSEEEDDLYFYDLEKGFEKLKEQENNKNINQVVYFPEETPTVDGITLKEFSRLRDLVIKNGLKDNNDTMSQVANLYISYKRLKEELILVTDEYNEAYGIGSKDLDEFTLDFFGDFNEGWEDIMLMLDHMKITNVEHRHFVFNKLVSLENEVMDELLNKEKFSERDLGVTRYNREKITTELKKSLLNNFLKRQEKGLINETTLKFFSMSASQAKHEIINQCKMEKERFDFFDKKMSQIENDFRDELKKTFTEEDLKQFENNYRIRDIMYDLRCHLSPFPDSYQFKNLEEFSKYLDEGYAVNKDMMLKSIKESISLNIQHYKHLSKEQLDLIDTAVREIKSKAIIELRTSKISENDEGFIEVQESILTKEDLNKHKILFDQELKAAREELIKDCKLLKKIDKENITKLIASKRQSIQEKLVNTMHMEKKNYSNNA